MARRDQRHRDPGTYTTTVPAADVQPGDHVTGARELCPVIAVEIGRSLAGSDTVRLFGEADDACHQLDALDWVTVIRHVG